MTAIEKYQPSNGTESADFFDYWCARCQHDKVMNGEKDFNQCNDNDLCWIVAAVLRLKVNDNDYPPEWSYGDDGKPCCTAFVMAGNAIPFPDEWSLDLFAESDPEEP
jgi:hypothetical protein